MNIIPRSEWKARAPRSALVPFTNSRISHIATHFPGSAATIGVESFDEATTSKLVPDYLWVSPEQAAKVSLDGLARNKMRVVPGLPAKVMSVTNQYAPRSIIAPIVGRVYRQLAGG